MANIEIGGRLHSTATGNVVTGANEVLDDTKNKKQSVINAEVDEAIGDDDTEGTIKGRIKAAENKLDTLNGDASTSGSVAKAVADAKAELIDEATSDGNTLKKVEDRTATLETAVGSNGSVDQRIAAAKSEVIGDAADDYNTLGKLEDKIQEEVTARGTAITNLIGDAASDYNTLGKLEDAIQAEASARQDAITAETNRATTRENQIYDLVHTPEQHYVTVATYAELTNIASPSDDTIYRVSSYNGNTNQVDNTVYSEYGYNGTNFVFLCVKSQIDEVYDISAHHSNNTYVDLAAALDGGNNIPQELRRGGMSVKYVQSSDNKYVQYFLTKNQWSASEADWEKTNLEKEISQLGQEVDGLEITFEAGAINYLNGILISDGKSIRTDAIPISKDVRIIGHFPRTFSSWYIVKYLNGVYAGYEGILDSGMNIDRLLQKDATFDSFRLRVSVLSSLPDWTAQDILDSSALVYVQNSVFEKVTMLSSSVQEIENKITSTPSSLDNLLTMQGTLQLLQRMSQSYFTKIKNQYAALNNFSVGSTFIFQTVNFPDYTYEYISVEEGDVILLTTSGNTVNAKSYAIIDAEDKVLAIHPEAVANVILVMPTGAKKFVANTYTTTNNYALIHIIGKVADYDSAVEQLRTFERGEYSFKSNGHQEPLSNGPIPSGSIIMAVTGSNVVPDINLYDENGENRLNLSISSLPYTTTRDYYKASTYIDKCPLLTIVTEGIKDVLEDLQKTIAPDGSIVSKKYGIANYDNDFSFDNLFVGQLETPLLQLQRNFELPCEGTCISTDVENVTILSEPVTGEQMLKANAPYLYIDGVKRGTIVLFDTDGTPFIYDTTGTKRYLTLL